VQVEQFLENSAQQRPHKVAVVCGGQRLTYAQVDQAANRLANGLIAAGVRRGDRVAVYLENTIETVVGIFATLKAGGVFMVINPTTKADKLSFILNNSRAAALLTDVRRSPMLQTIAGRTPHTELVVFTGPSDPGAALQSKRLLRYDELTAETTDFGKPLNRSIDIDLAALIYTSGSTGTPKGVMLTHLNIVAAATSITTYLENVADDVILDVLPLSFDYGLYQVLMAFKVGATIVLERSFAFPHAVLETVVSEGITGLPIVPTISAILLQLDLSKYDLSRLRYVTNTAAALPTAHILELRRRLPHARIYSMYGLTECKRVSYLPPDQIDVRPTSVGRGMPNEEVYLVDPDGQRLMHGVGELVIRGSNVMKGYWELPEETERVLRPGALPGERVLYSGDLFRMDEEGYLYFLGRKDDIIKTRGEKVSPREVENVLYEIAAVADAAVVGVPDPVLGQALKAVLTVKPGATLTERSVLSHCAERLENFMVPKIVEFRSSMPKTSSGKIDKKTLHETVTSAPLQG
jgi:amino acid adenylation domain-containing protein